MQNKMTTRNGYRDHSQQQSSSSSSTSSSPSSPTEDEEMNNLMSTTTTTADNTADTTDNNDHHHADPTTTATTTEGEVLTKSEIMKEADRILDDSSTNKSITSSKEMKLTDMSIANMKLTDMNMNMNMNVNYKKQRKTSCIMVFICSTTLFVIILLLISYNHIGNKYRNNNYQDYNFTLSNLFPKELLNDDDYNYYNKDSNTGSNTDGNTDGNTDSNTMTKTEQGEEDRDGEEGVYSLTEFRNDVDRTVPYWEDVLSNYNVLTEEEKEEYYNNNGGGIDGTDGTDGTDIRDGGYSDEIYNYGSTGSSTSKLLRKKNDENNDNGNNKNNENNDNEDNIHNNIIPHLGPCYLPLSQKEMNNIQWSELIQKNYHVSHEERNITYPNPYPSTTRMHGHTKRAPTISMKINNGNNTKVYSNLENFCRPGFIIIGAGKCGTSSLYHYLVGHERVVPAKQKQIHYFKYFTRRPMSWYLSHFYNTQDFLSSGSLMTGEASPGYLPYPDVAHRIQQYMKTKAGNGYNQPVSMPKIITIVRNPLERSWSSYNYNYIQPNLDKLKKQVKRKKQMSSHHSKGRFSSKSKYTSSSSIPHDNSSDSGSSRGTGKLLNRNDHHKNHETKNEMVQTIIDKNMTDDEIIETYFFSFEQLINAEMKHLKRCLSKGGTGEQGAEKLYGNKAWARPLFERRGQGQGHQEDQGDDKGHRKEKRAKKHKNDHNPLPPLVTLDESCYGDTISPTVPREQWKELIQQHPAKIINVQNLHLVQSLVGRSLYSLPLEWWYELYSDDDLYLVCNEDLKYRPSETMSELSEFLGLPSFNFDSVVTEGMYNVGGNAGYDKVTEWKDTDVDENDDGIVNGNINIEEKTTSSTSSNHKKNDDGILISDKMRKEYLSFVKPYNDRLFEMTQTRCDW